MDKILFSKEWFDEQMYELRLLPEQYDVEAMVAHLKNALQEPKKAQVIH